MHKRDYKISQIKRYISCLLISFLVMPVSLGIMPTKAEAIGINNPESIHNEKVAKEIFFAAHKNNNFPLNGGRALYEYILTANLNDPSVELMTSKASDRVLKVNSVSHHISREQGLGKQVVAGINGDMYNISAGTIHYGAPLGLQVQNGELIVGFETLGSASRYPIFIIDKEGKPLISYVKMDNRLIVNNNHSPNSTIDIDTMNRNNTAVMYDKMFLITSKIAENPVISFTDDQGQNANFTILKNVNMTNGNAIRLGQEYSAEVVAINETSPNFNSMSISPDMVVLASQGLKANWVRQNLRVGDRVTFSFNLNDLTGRRLEVNQAISSYLPLVQNGRALTEAEMLKLCENDWDKGTATIRATDKARTAIGYTENNEVIALAVDGGGLASNSYGASLPSMAKRLEDLGVVAAVSLDGGGSTQVNTRLFGEEAINVINTPSDGRERLVSNAILFVSKAPRTYELAELKIDRDITIFKNNSFYFKVRGADSNSHPADFNKGEVVWELNSTLPNSNSLINKNGLFTAGDTAETLDVVANYKEVNSSAQIVVVDTVGSLDFVDSGIASLPLNTPKLLQVRAYTTDKTPIILTNKDIAWSVSPATIANISPDGIITPLTTGEGVVTARIGDKEARFNFVAGLNNKIIDSYETNQNQYYIDGYAGGWAELSKTQVKNGQYSLKVNYDYANWDRGYNGSINIRLNDKADKGNYSTNIRPQKLGMWVYGDGQAPWLRAVLKDGLGNSHLVNLAPHIDWVGWQYVSVPIPSDIALPVSLDYFYMVETDKGKHIKGSVCFDDIEFVYY
ncbi:MAG: phosphodiester glycosidase family protein [Syntrophomonadaceae bacterium]|nr:phosphodiester glycosidase family protein [Syntrophomonadaceae bacterium]